MQSLPLHPMIVHLPIALAVLMPAVSAALLFAWWRTALPRRTWVIAVALQGLLVVSGIVSLRTGQREEERVERVVAEQLLERHEEAAEAFLWATAVVFLLGLAAAGVRDDANARRVAAAATLGTLLVLGFGYRVGEAGGRLVYEQGAANAYMPSHGTSPARDRDDD